MSRKSQRNRESNEGKEAMRRWRVSLDADYGIFWKPKSLRITTEIPDIDDIMTPLMYSVYEYVKLEKPFFLDANPIAEGCEVYVGQLVHSDLGVIGVTNGMYDTRERALFEIVTQLPTIPTVKGIFHKYNADIAAMYEMKRQKAEAKNMEEVGNIIEEGQSNGL